MSFFFFFNDTATTEIYTLSLHDALPIYIAWPRFAFGSKTMRCLSVGRDACTATSFPAWSAVEQKAATAPESRRIDRKSTRLNSSHLVISYAVFCLKKKKTNLLPRRTRRH